MRRKGHLELKGAQGILWTFCVAVILMLIAYLAAGIIPGSGGMAWNTDTMDQMASFCAMLARHIKNGDSIFYSWETSLGQNTALIYALCAYSPMVILYLFIPDIYIATIIGMLLKVALAAVFFFVFLYYGLEWKKNMNIFFSLCYAFSGFMLEYMMATNLLDAIYLLPLVMWALLRSIRDKKFLLLSLIYALSFIIEMYMSFLVGLFSAAFLIAILYLKDGKEFIKKDIMYLIGYTVSVISAILLSMCLLWPAITCYFSYNGFNAATNVEHIAITDLFYSVLFGRSTSLRTNIPFLYCGLPAVFLIPIYFTNKRINKRERILVGVGLASLILTIYLDPLYLFLHVFNRPDGFTVRYAFVYVFLMVIVAARSLYCIIESPEQVNIKSLSVYVLMIFTVAISLILLHDNVGEVADGKSVRYALWGNSVLILLWWGVAVLYLKAKGVMRSIGTVVAYTLLGFELLSQTCFNIREQGLLWDEWVKDKDMQMKEFIQQLDEFKTKDDEPYRAYAASYPGYNQNAWYGFMGIGQFSSSNYAAINKSMKKLGNPASAMSYSQEGATDFTDMFLAVRYRGRLTDPKEYGGPLFEVYDRALPLGFICSENILAGIEDDGNPFEYQNRLASALYGEGIAPYIPADELVYAENNAVYTESDEEYNIQKKADAEIGDVLFGIPKNGYEHAYAYFQILPHNGDIQEYAITDDMATEVTLFSEDDRKGNGTRFEYISNSSIMEMSEDENLFLIRMADYDVPEKTIRYTNQFFYYQNEEALDRVYSELSRGSWEIEEFKSNCISGKVRVPEDDRVLFMSIPYDVGWKAYMDGRVCDIIPVLDDSFMAIKAGQGDHEIILEYNPPGKIIGGILSLCGAMILFAMTIICKQNRVCMKGE